MGCCIVFRRSGAARVALVLSSTAVLFSSAAAAASTRLAYQAPDGCPPEASFIAAVQARGASLDAPAQRPEQYLLRVAIEHDANGFSGTFQLGDGESASGLRSVHAPTCAEVGDALAVVTAIALQADAAASAAPAAPPPPAPPPALRSPALPAAPAVDVAPRHRVIRTVWGEERLPVAAGELHLDHVQGYTASVGAQFGVVRGGDALPRYDFTLSRTNVVTTPGDEDLLIGGILRVRWSFLGPTDFNSSFYVTRLWGFKAGIGGCTPFVHDLDGLVLKACSEISAGSMHVETRDQEGGVKRMEDNHGLGVASADLVGEYNIGSVFHVGLTLGGEAWFTRIVADDPDGDGGLFETEVLSGYASLNVGLHFW